MRHVIEEMANGHIPREYQQVPLMLDVRHSELLHDAILAANWSILAHQFLIPFGDFELQILHGLNHKKLHLSFCHAVNKRDELDSFLGGDV